MNYLLKSKPKSKINWKYILVICLFLFFSAMIWFFGNNFRALSYTISRPIWRFGEVVSLPFVKVKDFFVLKNTLIEENKALTEENALLRLKETDYDILLKEHQDLKNIMDREIGRNRILARVLSKPPRSPYDTMVIDIGSKDGVIMGDRVYLSENIIIGLVKNVTQKTSLVEMFSSGGNKLEASVQRTGASYEIVGQGGTNLRIEVPKEADIVEGDVFVYPNSVPYAIANVYHIDDTSQGSFKTVYLRIPGNVFESKWVFVDEN